MIQILRTRKLGLNQIISLALVLAALAFVAYVLARDGRQLLSQPVRLSLPLVGLSFVIACSGYFIAVPVWRRILASYGVRQSWQNDLRIYSYSALALVLPGGIWNIVSRTALYGRLGVKGMTVAAASVVETLVSGVAAMAIYSAASLARPELTLWKRPEIGILFSIATLVLIQPRVFNRLINWAIRKKDPQAELLQVHFGMGEMAVWIGLEIGVVAIGGGAMYTLLASLTPVSPAVFLPVAAAWAAAVAAGNLFFWLPGTPFLRDGAMLLALTPSLSLPVAVVFVLLIRLWSVASLLVIAGGVWLGLDLPARLRRNRPPEAH
ncbi:MAG TPA: hypothetical protein VF498_07045 [Anaerolineales bacterium]